MADRTFLEFFAGGGMARGAGRRLASNRRRIIVVEDGQVRTRLISAREPARLTGLPDEYH